MINIVTIRVPGMTGRLLVAMALSLLAHVLLAKLWTGAGSQPGAVNAPLQARLDTGAADGDAVSVRAALVTLVTSPLHRPDAGHIFPAIRSSSAPGVATPPTAVSAQYSPVGRKVIPKVTSIEPAAQSETDHRFYLARELDHFPVPLWPLSLDLATAGSAANSVRLWVSIDRTGRVLDAVVVAAQTHDADAQTLRERVLATPFRPARKDAQAVSSRVLLVLGEGQ